MKKILFIIMVATAFVSCSSSNDDVVPTQNNTTTTVYFHPPTWIQGTWGITSSTSSNKLYRFTTDDFILMPDTSNNSMTASIKAHPYGGSVNELINNATEYKFDVIFNNSVVTQSFYFRKVSATQIQLKDNGNSWTDLVKM